MRPRSVTLWAGITSMAYLQYIFTLIFAGVTVFLFVSPQCVWTADGRGGQQHVALIAAHWEEQGKFITELQAFPNCRVIKQS